MNQDIVHETIDIRRTIDASPEHLFSAWERPDARVQWGPPSDDEAIKFIKNDFRVGGKDVSLCGPKDNMSFQVETTYYDIRKPERLLFTERVSMDDTPLSISLITVALSGVDAKTLLRLTVQITSLVGEDMIKGNRDGWHAALTNLANHLD